jgi:hypothetical protein
MSERLRLETLIARDGLKEAKDWALKTLRLYRASCEASHYASQSEWKPLFLKSIQELERFVDSGDIP